MLQWILLIIWCVRCLSSPADQFLSVRRSRCSLAGGGSWRPGWGYRRQVVPAISHKLSIQENYQLHAPNYKMGPEKSATYDPNYGYEPYWAGGSWVLHPTANQTEEPDDYCNNKCSPLYKTYGKICSRDKSGKYQTFENYCKMAATDCTEQHSWKITYRGPCMSANQGEQGGISVKHTKAKPQPNIKKDIIQQFFNKYKRPVGGGMVASTTAVWKYTRTYTDY